MNTEYLNIEGLLLEADRLFANEDYFGARKVLEEAVATEPKNGRVHSYLGWYYLTQMDNYKRAKIHYAYALKYAPEFPGTYWYFCYTLFELKEYKVVINVALQGLKVAGVDEGLMYVQLANAEGRLCNYKTAIAYCETGLDITTNDYAKAVLTAARNRLKEKVRNTAPWYTMFW